MGQLNADHQCKRIRLRFGDGVNIRVVRRTKEYQEAWQGLLST